MPQKKTAPTTQHSYFHFCTILSCYWFLKWPELTEIPHGFCQEETAYMEEKADEERKLILQFAAIMFSFFNSINRACNEILSSFFLFCHNYSLNFGGTEVLGLAFWILNWESPSTCHRIREKETKIQVGLLSPSSTVLLSTHMALGTTLSTRNEQTNIVLELAMLWQESELL